MDAIHLQQHELASDILGNRRAVWVQPPPAACGKPVGACIFLDGEYYLTGVRAAGIVADAQAQGVMPPVLSAYVSVIDYRDVRWTESFCNPDFAAFIVDELLPWLAEHGDLPRGATHTIAGLSLTGLSAAHVALHRPGSFARVLCQSGSFWWEDGRLARDMSQWAPSDCAFRLSVGSEETDENVDHGKGLIQVQSQLASNRQMRDALSARGHRVSFGEFEGGHSVPAWRTDLPTSLAALFSDHRPT